MGGKFLQLILFFHYCFSHPTSDNDYEIKIETVTEPVTHGEGPHWDKYKKILYFVDTNGQTVNAYDPETNEVNQVYIEGPDQVNLVITDQFEDDRYLISRGRDMVAIKWDGISPTPSETVLLTTTDTDKPGNMINDGKADSRGQLWAGSKGPGTPNVVPDEARFYSFKPDFEPVVQLSPVSISNGIAWNSEDTLLYYIDSPTRKIDIFDFDLGEGEICNRRTLFSLDDYDIPGIPDGMDIDENDNIWVAVLNSSSVLHIDTTTGKLIRRIILPVTYVTSCAFGGEELEHLYVTTSNSELKGDELDEEPDAGSVYRLSNLGVRGQNKPNEVRIF